MPKKYSKIDLKTLNIKQTVENYLKKITWKVKENSNQRFSYSSISWRLAGEMMTNYTLSEVYAKKISNAHLNGDLHIHNLYMGIAGYCAGHSIQDILMRGIGIPWQVNCAPPKHFDSALNQLANFVGVLQNEWAGAQAFNSLDVFLAPFIRKDGLSYKDVKQKLQGFIYTLNLPTRWGGQTPFTNITFDIKVPDDLADKPVIIGGKLERETYKEFQPEIDIINRAFMEVMTEGNSQQRVFTFPIPTYNITKDFDWDSPIADLMFEMTAKYGIPYFQNFIRSELDPHEIRAMCCRLRLELKKLKYRRIGGYFGYADKTGCYDERTEVLTKNGWKLFKDVKKEDEILTLNPQSRELEYQKPLRFFEYDYDGKVIKIESKSLDLLITPNHNMFVERATTTTRGSREKKSYYFKPIFCKANELNSNHDRIPKTGKWNCTQITEFVLPEISFIKYGKQGRTPYWVIIDPKKIKIENWLKFLGIYLAEGSTDNEKIAKTHGYRIFITQENKKKKKKIKEMLNNLPFNWHEIDKGFVIYNKQLWSYLKKLGNRYTKFIPIEFKQLLPEQLNILLDWMILGDGKIRYVKEKNRIPRRFYWTVSKRLADDVQELLIKIGNNAQITIQKKKDCWIGERKIKASSQKDCYLVSEHVSKHHYLRSPTKGSFIKKEKYKGKVYCLEVPNHVMGVRRNGKVAFCGNSVGVVTINVPRIGYLAKSEKDFFKRLEKLMEIAKDSLEIKRKVVAENIKNGVLPFTQKYLGTLKYHFATIGPIGMNETCLNFLGKDIATDEGKQFAIKTLNFMRERLVKYQKETGNIYNLEAVPAESTCYRLAKIDKEKYPKIKTAGVKVPYYTNSTFLPVDYTKDVFAALEHQNDLQTLYTGGTVFHVYLGERIEGKEAKLLVKKILESYDLPCITLAPTFSICSEHGYISGEHFKCPKCGKQAEVYSRVVGFFTSVQNWNIGKKEEFRQRKEYKL